MRVEAVHAVSWLWVSRSPSVSHTTTEDIGKATKTASTRLISMLPLLRRRAGRPRMPLAALFMCVCVYVCVMLIYYRVAGRLQHLFLKAERYSGSSSLPLNPLSYPRSMRFYLFFGLNAMVPSFSVCVCETPPHCTYPPSRNSALGIKNIHIRVQLLPYLPRCLISEGTKHTPKRRAVLFAPKHRPTQCFFHGIFLSPSWPH